MIRAGQGSELVGDGAYGDDQTVEASVTAGKTKRFLIGVENDGRDADVFTVRGCASQRGMSVAYVHDGSDITDAMTSGTFETGELEPGRSTKIALRIKVKKNSDVRAGRCRVVLSSGDDGSIRDVVEAKIRVHGAGRDGEHGSRFCTMLVELLGLTGDERADLNEDCRAAEAEWTHRLRPPSALEAFDVV